MLHAAGRDRLRGGRCGGGPRPRRGAADVPARGPCPLSGRPLHFQELSDALFPTCTRTLAVNADPPDHRDWTRFERDRGSFRWPRCRYTSLTRPLAAAMACRSSPAVQPTPRQPGSRRRSPAGALRPQPGTVVDSPMSPPIPGQLRQRPPGIPPVHDLGACPKRPALPGHEAHQGTDPGGDSRAGDPTRRRSGPASWPSSRRSARPWAMPTPTASSTAT